MDEKLSVSVRDAAILIGVSKRKLEYMIKDGYLQVFRLGRRVLLDMRDLTAMIDRLKADSQIIGGRNHVQHIEE